MAMLPFCGYNMGDYWNHWLEVGHQASRPPAVFQVNWFRRDSQGHFIWPGFGQNMRVLRWIYQRLHGQSDSDAVETPLGYVPTAAAIGAMEAGLNSEQSKQLLQVDRDEWKHEAEDHAQYLSQFGDHLPGLLREEQRSLAKRLS